MEQKDMNMNEDIAHAPAVMGIRSWLLVIAIYAAVFCVFALFYINKDKKMGKPLGIDAIIMETLVEDPKPTVPPKPVVLPKPVDSPKIDKPIIETKVPAVVQTQDKNVTKRPTSPVTKVPSRQDRINRIRGNVRIVTPRAAPSDDTPGPSAATIRHALADTGPVAPSGLALSARDERSALARIGDAYYSRWTDRPAWTDTLKPIVLRVWFGDGGQVLRSRLERSSGDGCADRTVLDAARRVVSVPGLPEAFVREKAREGVCIRFTVTP